MALTLVPTFPLKWYTRSNTATALLSLAIAIYYGVYEFVLTGSQDDSGINYQLAVLAITHALYGLTLFFAISFKYPRASGFASFLMFVGLCLYSFWITKDVSNTYFSMLIIAAVLSGLYGWLLSSIINLFVITLLILVDNGTISANDNFSTLQIIIYSIVSVMTIVLWNSIGSGIEEGSSLKDLKLKKRSKKSALPRLGNLSTDVLLDSITDGVAIVNSQGAIESFNPSAVKLTGWSEDEANGIDHRSVLIFTDQQDKIYSDQYNPVSRALTSGQPATDTNAKLQTRSRKFFEVDVLVSPILDARNKTAAAVVIFRDVSKQRSEERQRAEFISTASHEMRTPVAAIEGYLALAMNERVSKIDTAARGYLEKAHASTQHLGKLFQDLLTAAKSEDGRLTNNPRVVEIGQLLDELIEGVRFTAEKKGLLMEADFGDGKDTHTQSAVGTPSIRPLTYVLVDPERLREVLTNLFDNAVKYTDEGKITIGMRNEDNQVVIRVSDTGPGIPQEDIPHLFQKFYRVDNSATRQIGGTGLGLFISRKIIELYNGRIWAESTLGEGSTFNIALPKLDNERAQEMMRAEAQTVSPLPEGVQNSPGSLTEPGQYTDGGIRTPAPAPIRPAATTATPAAPVATTPATPSVAPATTPAPAPAQVAQPASTPQPTTPTQTTQQ